MINLSQRTMLKDEVSGEVFQIGDIVLINTNHNENYTGRIKIILQHEMHIDTSKEFYTDVFTLSYGNISSIVKVRK